MKLENEISELIINDASDYEIAKKSNEITALKYSFMTSNRIR